MRKLPLACGLLALLMLSFPSLPCLQAQTTPTTDPGKRTSAVRLFIDCQAGCDRDYIREEIPYVNYVRDVHEAQLYLLITRQSTGSGGRRYTLFYAGQQEFAGMKDTLSYSSGPDDTQDVVREGLTSTMALGLMRYVAKTPLSSNIQIGYRGERQEEAGQVADNWNHWVFQIEIQPGLSIEQRNKEFSWDLEIDIDRVTNEWKIENELEFDHEKEIFLREEFDEEAETITETRTEAVTRSWLIDNKTVKSLTEHWSAGIMAEISSSSYRNLDLRASLKPAVEYNIFPYSQYNRRAFYIRYGLGYVYQNYSDTTIYNKLEESLFEQSLDINLQVRQRWGSSEISLVASSFLHDFHKNYVGLRGNLNLRLFRGFSLSLFGNLAFIHNQIELPKGSRTAEEVYLRLRELETNYRFQFGVGLTYTFGSIFSNIVNPRF
jgi:hypothetical protein